MWNRVNLVSQSTLYAFCNTTYQPAFGLRISDKSLAALSQSAAVGIRRSAYHEYYNHIMPYSQLSLTTLDNILNDQLSSQKDMQALPVEGLGSAKDKWGSICGSVPSRASVVERLWEAIFVSHRISKERRGGYVRSDSANSSCSFISSWSTSPPSVLPNKRKSTMFFRIYT